MSVPNVRRTAAGEKPSERPAPTEVEEFWITARVLEHITLDATVTIRRAGGIRTAHAVRCPINIDSLTVEQLLGLLADKVQL